MKHDASQGRFAGYRRFVPAWVIKCLPVRVARPLLANVAASSASVSASIPASQSPAQSSFSSSNRTTRQLLVDVSVIYQSDARTGIQRVVRSLLLQLLAMPPAGYRVCPVFATRRQAYSHAAPGFMTNPAHPKPHPQQKAEPIRAQTGDLFLGLDLAAHLLPRHQPQLLGWKKKGVALHVMVYDLLPLQNPEWFNARTTRNFSRWIKWVAVYADSAICISEFVKVELAAWLSARFGLPAGTLPTSTIVLGADLEASAPSDGMPADADFLLARLRATPAVLMVGTLEPRKGYDQALAAFEHLWQQPGKSQLLVIVGRPGWKTDGLQHALRTHPQAGKRLFWLEDASDEYLARLYAACTGVLVASRAEGFGLPLIEAARYGKPVLARDIAVFRETTVTGVEYFSSETPQALATSIEDWLKDGPALSQPTLNKRQPTWQLAAAQLSRALGLLPATRPLKGIEQGTSECRADGTSA
jgi:glycosyltransferase involved in cell wall biosynthesis